MKRLVMVWTISVLLGIALAGCLAPQVKLFSAASDPLKEYTLSGDKEGKVLMIPVNGIISDAVNEEMFQTRPSMVQEIIAQLDLARQDPEIKAVVLKIDSPGGSVTASDIIYHELIDFKEETGAKVVVSMMNMAASGGYYIALPSDHIMAHPTTVTGSVGVIFIRPNVRGLMDKIGVDVKVDASGINKDMGSPFRQTTEREAAIFENLIETLGDRFVKLVSTHRSVPETIGEIATARIFLAEDALEAGLIDEIGYLPQAIDTAKKLAGLPEESKVVVYRRTYFPNDNIYNSIQMRAGMAPSALIDLGLPRNLTRHLSGFYYLWTPGLED